MLNEKFGEPAGACRLLLPPKIYAVPGEEVNLYFGNVVLSAVPGQFLFDVICPKGAQFSRCWTWIPGDEPGIYPLQLEVRSLDDRILAVGATQICVAEPNAGAKASIALNCIGDSLTCASVYTAELLKLCNRANSPSLVLLGTQQTDPESPDNRHEGYGGWRYETFNTQWRPDADAMGPVNEVSSPFLFQGDNGPELDYGRYISEKLGDQQPDFVCVMLGINDIYLATETTREQAVDVMIENASILVAEIRKSAPGAALGIVPPVPPSSSQDAFGMTSGGLQTRRGYLQNYWLAVARLMQVFGGRGADSIHLVPAYANLDCDFNYPTIERSANARNELKIQIAANDVHPSASGYAQIADSIYYWIKWQLSLQSSP